MKTLKSYIPELCLIIATLTYWFFTVSLINWFAIGLLVALGLLIFTKNKIFGICLSLFFILINSYMVLALLSELSEFTEFNNDAKKLLLFGSLFLGFNLIFSTLLFIKNIKSSIKEPISL